LQRAFVLLHFGISYHPCLAMHTQPKEAAGKLYLLQDPETLPPILITILKYAELPLFSSKPKLSFLHHPLLPLSLLPLSGFLYE